MDANLVKRIAFAVVAIPLALLVVWQGGWVLAALIALVAALATRELFAFAHRHEIRPLAGFGTLSAAALPLLVYWNIRPLGESGSTADPFHGWAWFLAALWVVALLAVTLAARRPGDRPLEAAGITLLGVLYTGALPASLLVIRHAAYPTQRWEGAWLVFFPLVITWVVDTAAMFGGRAMQGPKLWPAISPGKTWSGSVAGVVGGLVAVPILNALVLEPLGIALPLRLGLPFALVLGIVGQAGDLAESLFKREVGVKDSSALIPGHGGVLDRFDSLYFVLPCAAAMYRLFGLI
ncbi:MAG TPA: phosphatidate cytidylyltransferase [Gemmatimonadales bacterium]|nr:phosphatidate cytidylyltransferase [Gemmatimonadales bacterium]